MTTPSSNVRSSGYRVPRYVVQVSWRPYGKAEPRQEAEGAELLAIVQAALEMGADTVRVNACRCDLDLCCIAHGIHSSPHKGCILR